jgi:E3 ubiquitin-protein ligase SHPRH
MILKTLEAAEKEIIKLKNEIDSTIVEHNAKGEILKKEAAALREERRLGNVGAGANDKGKSKARDLSPLTDDEYGEDEEEEDTEEDKGLPKTPAGREHRDKGRALRQRLREAQIILHRVIFLKGDAHHNLGAAGKEDEAYHNADLLRKDLLKRGFDICMCPLLKRFLSLLFQSLPKRLSREWLSSRSMEQNRE